MGKIVVGIFLMSLLAAPGVTYGEECSGCCKPGKLIKVINKDTVEEVKEFLPPTIYLKVKEWGLEFNWVETTYDYQPPKPFRDATEKYKGTSTINSEDSIENYVAGFPFPDIDPNDPDVARKIMWNFGKKYMGDDHYYNNSRAITLDRKGNRRHSGMSFWLLRTTGRTILNPIPRFEDDRGLQEAQISITNEPEANRGAGMLKLQYVDPNKEDAVWFFVPSLRRVVRASAGRGQEAYAGTDTTWDDNRFWSGRIEENKYRFLGVEEILAVVCEDKSTFVEGRVDVANHDDTGGFIHGGNYEKVPTYKIEVIHKDPKYHYSKSIWWIDPRSYEGLYAENWDNKGRLFKNFSQRLTYDNEKGSHYGPHWEFVDHQTRHYTNWVASDYTENNNPKLSFFSLETLRRGMIR